MIKLLWCRFQKCLGTFTMLFVEGYSQTRIFRHLYDYVFGVCNFGNTKSLRVIFLFKIFQISSRFQKCSKKNSGKVFSYWDNCIWIGIVKLFLLRTGYLSPESNFLTSSPKIWHVNQRDFFWLNWLGSDQWIW